MAFKRAADFDKLGIPPTIAGPLFDPPASQPFDRSQIPPTDQETRIAGLIWQHQGRHNPISIDKLIGITQLPERSIKGIVEQLRTAHRMPIGANRTAPIGYFWVVDEADREAAVAPYRAQVLAMWRTLRVLDNQHSLRELLGQLRIED